MSNEPSRDGGSPSPAHVDGPTRARRRAAIFLALVVLFSTPLWLLHRTTGYAPYITLLMWCPGLAGVATLRLTGGRMTALGWNGASLRWTLFGWTLTAGGLALAYAAVCAMHLATFPDPRALGEVAREMRLQGACVPLLVMVRLGLSLTAAVVNGGGRALGEELGWRGFLTPAANEAFGFLPGSVFCGLIWAAWHFPLMLGAVTVQGFINFTIMVTGMGVAYAWVRTRSGSVWPTTIMHATHNAFRGAFLTPLVVGVGGSNLWLDETGYALAALGLLLGALAVAGHLVADRPSLRRPDEGGL